jgi:hypothetical protein
LKKTFKPDYGKKNFSQDSYCQKPIFKKQQTNP